MSPLYITSPFKPSPVLLISGRAQYLFGSCSDRTGPTIGFVVSVHSNGSTTGTVVFQIMSGNLPAVGSLISIVGTTVGGGNFNVTNATILTESDNGNQVTVTFAIVSTATPTSATADSGQVMIPQPEVGETLVNGASVPCAVSFSTASPDQDRAFAAVVSFPTLPTAAVVTLQQAVIDLDAEYADIATVISVSSSAIVSGGQITVDPVLGKFFRFNVSGHTGGGTIVGKLLS